MTQMYCPVVQYSRSYSSPTDCCDLAARLTPSLGVQGAAVVAVGLTAVLLLFVRKVERDTITSRTHARTPALRVGRCREAPHALVCFCTLTINVFMGYSHGGTGVGSWVLLEEAE